MPKPIVEREVGVRVGAGRASRATTTRPTLVATAVKLAARRRRGIHVLVLDHGAIELADRREHAGPGEPRRGDHRLDAA